mgnify:CR=1 FL=1
MLDEDGEGGVMEDSETWSVEQGRAERGEHAEGTSEAQMLHRRSSDRETMHADGRADSVTSATVVVTPGAGQRAVVKAVATGKGSRVAVMTDVLSQTASQAQADAPACDSCGSITMRSGTCYKCMNCGSSMGCS